MPGAAVSSGRRNPRRTADTGWCRTVPGHPSNHGATVDRHWSRPLCLGRRRHSWERPWALPAKVQASGAAQRDTCDPGPVRDADTLRDSCWRRPFPLAPIVPSASRASSGRRPRPGSLPSKRGGGTARGPVRLPGRVTCGFDEEAAGVIAQPVVQQQGPPWVTDAERAESALTCRGSG
jgi:hypothetical protein